MLKFFTTLVFAVVAIGLTTLIGMILSEVASLAATMFITIVVARIIFVIEKELLEVIFE